MGRQTVSGNHKMELTMLKHHFILIDSQKLSASKDPFVRNVLFLLIPVGRKLVSHTKTLT